MRSNTLQPESLESLEQQRRMSANLRWHQQDLFDAKGPVEQAAQYALQAEKHELEQNMEEAAKSYMKASEFYLEAKAKAKTVQGVEEEALKTLEILADTYKRKAKLIRIRKDSGVGKLRENLKEKKGALRKEKAQARKNILLGINQESVDSAKSLSDS